jgi:hypothetical protein
MNKPQFYTLKEIHDGFGANYQRVMSLIAYCNYNNFIYVHTPFTKLEHGADPNKMNIFIGINNDKLICDKSLPTNDDTILKVSYPKEVHYSIRPSIYYTDKVVQIIRDYYFNSPKPVIESIDIAIHIRRGDVIQSNTKRYTENDIYKRIIVSLKNKYPTYNILIFSEGKFEDFKDIGLENDHFRLNTELEVTFHSLVCAKILVMAKSSFSYSSAILNKNIVYYSDFWHKRLDDWLEIKMLI